MEDVFDAVMKVIMFVILILIFASLVWLIIMPLDTGSCDDMQARPASDTAELPAEPYAIEREGDKPVIIYNYGTVEIHE